MTISDRLAEFAGGFRPADLPAAVRDDARWRLVDTVGVAIAGSRMDYAEAVIGVATDLGGSPECSLIGRPGQLSAPLAGFVNAAFGHGPDFDDTHSIAMVHMSVVAVNAALAMGQRSGATGAEVLTAQVLGAEIGLRIAAAAPHLFHARNYHATGVVGPFAAAVAAAHLLHLDAAQIANAIGIAASNAGGLRQGNLDGTWMKRLHPAWSTQAGLLAALFAERGFLGFREALEGHHGLYNVLLHGLDPAQGEVDLESISEDLGHRWIYPESTFKPYPNGAWNHSSTDAVATIMRRDAVDWEQIDRIDVHVPAECIPIVCEPRELRLHPTSTYHLKFSLPWSVAMCAVRGGIGVEDFTEAVLADSRIAGLAARVHCHADPALTHGGFPAWAELTTTDGRRLEARVPVQRGGPGNPMTESDHRAKFERNVEPSLGAAGALRLWEALIGIWEAAAVDPLLELTRRAG